MLVTNKTSEIQENTNSKLETYLLMFIIFDIVFLPESPIYSLPFSLIVLVLYNLKNKKMNFMNGDRLKVFFLFSLLLSTVLSFISKESFVLIDNTVTTALVNVQKEDLKRLIYFLVGIGIYTTVYSLQRKNNVVANKSIKRLLLLICSFYFLFELLFIVDVNLFYQVKNLFFNSNVDMTSNAVLESSGYLTRFNFILLDPNNAFYYILMISIFLKENFKLSFSQEFFLSILILFSLFTTKSLGGAYSVLIYLILSRIFNIKKKIDIRKFFLVLTLLLLVVLFVLIDLNFNQFLLNSVLDSTTVQRWSSNSMSGRSEIYTEILGKFPPFIGNGYTLIMEGKYVTPHSDHLRFLYGYGIISYLLLAAISFKKKYLSNEYLFVIPACIAFSINSLIDEKRLFFTFLILISLVNSKKDRKYIDK